MEKKWKILLDQYMKIKFSSGSYLPLNKKLWLQNLIIIVRSVFQEDEKYYAQELAWIIKARKW